MHIRLHQLGFFWWDPRIDPREPDYDPDFDPDAELPHDPLKGSFLCYNMFILMEQRAFTSTPAASIGSNGKIFQGSDHRSYGRW